MHHFHLGIFALSQDSTRVFFRVIMEGQSSALVTSIERSLQEVREESEKSHTNNGDCLGLDFVSNLPRIKHLDLGESDLTELKWIWEHWGYERKQSFTTKYGDIALLLFVDIDEQLIRAIIEFWDPSYRCFTFNQEDLTPTIEEYTTLLRIESSAQEGIYWKTNKVSAIRKRLSKIMDIKIPEDVKCSVKKGSDCVPWRFLCDFIMNNQGNDRVIDIFALAIYGLVIFPKVLNHVEINVIDLFQRFDKNINPVPAILAETIRSLNYCRRKGKGRFVGCIKLLYIWAQSHLWKQSRKHVRWNPYIPIEEFIRRELPMKGSKNQWIKFLRYLKSEDIAWMAPWMPLGTILYRCGDDSWVPLLGVWGSVSYAPLLVRRQYGSKQFIPMTHGLNSLEFAYEGHGYMGKVEHIKKAWKKRYRSRLGVLSQDISPEYQEWRVNRIRDLILPPDEDSIQPVSLEPEPVVLSDIEIARQEFAFERANLEHENLKLQEDMENLKLKLDRKEKELEKVVKERDVSNSILDDLHKRKQRARGEAGHSRNPFFEYEQKRGELQAQIDALENKVRRGKEVESEFLAERRRWEQSQTLLKEKLEKCQRKGKQSMSTMVAELKESQQENGQLRASMATERKKWKQENEQLKASTTAKLQRYRQVNRQLESLWEKEKEKAQKEQNAKEQLEVHLQFLEQQLQSQETHITNLIYEHQEAEARWNHDYEMVLDSEGRWIANSLGRQLYIDYLTKEVFKVVIKAREMIVKVEALKQEVCPSGEFEQRLLNFLSEAKQQYEQISLFYGCNARMINDV